MKDTLLSGRTVLVVEDDFFLADDTRQTLEDAGATVFGPVSNAEDALRLLKQATPDCALLDVNLGAGPSFDLASVLTARDIPLAFMTGYDANVIPTEFAALPCLQKPMDARKLLAAVSALSR